MKKAPNPKIFLGLALGTFVVGAGINYMTYSGMSEAQEKVAQLKNQVKPTTQIQSELDASTKELTETSSQLKHLEANIPDFAYIPTMLAELEQVGKANGIEVTGVRPTVPPAANPKEGEKVARKPYDELIIEVKGRGHYGDVMKFIGALQTFPKIVALRSISMTPKNDPSKGTTDGLDLTIDLKAFVFPQPQTAPGASPATGKTAARMEVRHEG